MGQLCQQKVSLHICLFFFYRLVYFLSALFSVYSVKIHCFWGTKEKERFVISLLK